jgi:transposase-like protein
MIIDEFDAALQELGWKVSDFCRATGLHRNTPSRWRNEAGVEIPQWVDKHLALLLEIKRLHAQYLEPSTND